MQREIPISYAVIAALAMSVLYYKLRHERVTLPARRADGKRRRILITGAASGISLETAKIFVRNGWIVGMMDVSTAALERETQVIRDSLAAKGDGEAVWWRAADVTNEEECKRAVDDFAAKYGGLDVLINGAGILSIGLFKDTELRRQTKQIDVNFKGVCNMSYAALPHLLKSGGKEEPRRIVTMASGSAVSGIPNHAVYAATKAAVFSLTEALNIELDEYGLNVADVSVMYVNTNMVQSQTNQNTLILERGPSTFIAPQAVAQRIFEAVHQARLHREHFFVESSLNLTFKFMGLMRALGCRLGMRAVALTNMPVARSSSSSSS